MKKIVLAASFSLLLNFTATVFASDFSIVGTTPILIETHNPTSIGYAGRSEKQKVILLQKIELSPGAKKAFVNRIKKIKLPAENNFLAQVSENKQSLPDNVNIGMNHVPVLDQGIHGTCATFANAGLIDSLIGQKDYISELCSLTLGNYLAQKDPTYPSCWDGSYGPTVLKQMLNYGIVPMSIQKDVGCGGLTNYPKLNLSEEGASTTPKQYAVISESISERYEWHTLLSIDTAFIDERYNSEKVLFNVKKSLNEGTRVTFGVLLDLAQGLTGAVGSSCSH